MHILCALMYTPGLFLLYSSFFDDGSGWTVPNFILSVVYLGFFAQVHVLGLRDLVLQELVADERGIRETWNGRPWHILTWDDIGGMNVFSQSSPTISEGKLGTIALHSEFKILAKRGRGITVRLGGAGVYPPKRRTYTRASGMDSRRRNVLIV